MTPRAAYRFIFFLLLALATTSQLSLAGFLRTEALQEELTEADNNQVDEELARSEEATSHFDGNSEVTPALLEEKAQDQIQQKDDSEDETDDEADDDALLAAHSDEDDAEEPTDEDEGEDAADEAFFSHGGDAEDDDADAPISTSIEPQDIAAESLAAVKDDGDVEEPEGDEEESEESLLETSAAYDDTADQVAGDDFNGTGDKDPSFVGKGRSNGDKDPLFVGKGTSDVTLSESGHSGKLTHITNLAQVKAHRSSVFPTKTTRVINSPSVNIDGVPVTFFHSNNADETDDDPEADTPGEEEDAEETSQETRESLLQQGDFTGRDPPRPARRELSKVPDRRTNISD